MSIEQLTLFEFDKPVDTTGRYPYLDELRAVLSSESFKTIVPDRDGYITIEDDFGYDFQLNVNGGFILDLLGILKR